MEKKEFYRHALPHFQQPGQAYFVTWCLIDAVPQKALEDYTKKLNILKSQLIGIDAINTEQFLKPSLIDNEKSGANLSQKSLNEMTEIDRLKLDYYSLRKKYIHTYNKLLDNQSNPKINLTKSDITKIISDALLFWERKKLENFAFCVMPNHVHWVFQLFKKDLNGAPVYLQDIMYSIKRFTSNEINKVLFRKGSLWQKESFDTTIRDEKHLFNAIEYTLHNPVKAGWVKDWQDWKGCWSCQGYE
ncbi:MAG: transposase [Prolixibacteraceae bacterium]|nr:transposase [Prolixibacteraceae bacterium]